MAANNDGYYGKFLDAVIRVNIGAADLHDCKLVREWIMRNLMSGIPVTYWVERVTELEGKLKKDAGDA